MAAPTDLPLADTSDMIGLHRVFREALAAAPSFVGSVAPGDTKRAELVGSYYANVLDLLHSHHEGEDVLLTPRLLERAPGDAHTISRISAQHQTVLSTLEDVEQRIPSWQADPTAEATADLVAAMGRLEASLTEHLDDEEREILPIAAQHINVAEWGQLPEHGMKNFGGDKLWLVLGLIQEQMTDAQRANMEAHMPPPLLEMWTGPGRAMFADYVSEMRG